MIRRRTFVQALSALAAVAAPARSVLAAGGAPDLIVHGGKIHSVDPRMPAPEAFAVRGGRFIFTGSYNDALRLRGRATKILNLQGATVLPGLIDAHLHLTAVGLALHEVDAVGAASYEEVVRRTAAFARSSPDPWIFGGGWDQNLWPEKSFPTHDALSAAVPDRPVLLERVDGHAVLANAKAMAMAGVSKTTGDVAGGVVVRDGAGNPTGVFIDNAVRLVARAAPPPTHEQLVRAARAGAHECHRWGVTAIGEARTSAEDLAVFEQLARARQLDLRNYVRIEDDPVLIGARLQHGPVDAAHDGRLWVRAIKLFIDGALGSRGAALLQPYSDDAGNSGILRVTQTHIENVSELALGAGFQVCVHAIGDRGNRIVLDAFENTLAKSGKRDHRFRVEHAQVLDPADIPRFAKLGVIPSMQSPHQVSDMPWAERRLGPVRVRGAYAWRALLNTGVMIANGTDAPVEPVNSLRVFHSAITRENEMNLPPGGWYPSERMTRDEALKSMTMWAATANFQEHVIGSITAGKYADFVVMDRDWMTAEARDIMKTKVLSTYFGGKRVYDSSNAGHTSRAALRPRALSRDRTPVCCAAT